MDIQTTVQYIPWKTWETAMPENGKDAVTGSSQYNRGCQGFNPELQSKLQTITNARAIFSEGLARASHAPERCVYRMTCVSPYSEIVLSTGDDIDEMQATVSRYV